MNFSNYFAVHRIRKRIPNFIWRFFLPIRKSCVCSFFFVKTIGLVKKFVKIGLLFQRGFEPTVARLVGSFFWWSLYKAKEWPEYNKRIACSIIREFFTLLFPTQTTDTWWLAQIHIPIPYDFHTFYKIFYLGLGYGFGLVIRCP